MEPTQTENKDVARYNARLLRSAQKLHFDLNDVRRAIRHVAQDAQYQNERVVAEMQNTQIILGAIGGLIMQTNRTIEHVGEEINNRLDHLIKLTITQVDELNKVNAYLSTPAATASAEQRKAGFISIQNGEYPEAIGDFNAAIKLNDHDHIAWYGRGVANALQRKYEEAAADFAKSSRKATRTLNYRDSATTALLCRAAYQHESVGGDHSEEIWRTLILTMPHMCPDLAVPIAVEAARTQHKDSGRLKVAEHLLMEAFAVDPELVAMADSYEVSLAMINKACTRALKEKVIPQLRELEAVYARMAPYMHELELQPKLAAARPGPVGGGAPAQLAVAIIYKAKLYDAIQELHDEFKSLDSQYNPGWTKNGYVRTPVLQAKAPARTVKSLFNSDPNYNQELAEYNENQRNHEVTLRRIALFQDSVFERELASVRAEAEAVIEKIFVPVARVFQIDNDLLRMLGLQYL